MFPFARTYRGSCPILVGLCVVVVVLVGMLLAVDPLFAPLYLSVVVLLSCSLPVHSILPLGSFS